jgi:hypothetical protein
MIKMKVEVIKKITLPCPDGYSEFLFGNVAVLYFIELSDGRKGYMISHERMYEWIVDGEVTEGEVQSWISPTIKEAFEYLLEDLKWISVDETCSFCEWRKKCPELFKPLVE